MQIDWLTVIAQIGNFLILVWLLQRFLYRPITHAMQRRENRIAERLSQAKSARTDAENDARVLREKQDQLDAERTSILDAARADAATLRHRLQTELRDDIAQERIQWHQHLTKEQDAFAHVLQRRASEQVLTITARILQDYANTDIAEQVALSFINHLETLDGDLRGPLADAAGREGCTALVETQGPLTAPVRGQITRAIHAVLGTDIPVDYRTDDSLLIGSRLTIGDQTVEWSAGRYLNRVTDALREEINALAHSADGQNAPLDRKQA